MNLEISIDPKELAFLDDRLERYEKATGKATAEVMVELGKSVARQLAHKTQPYGLSSSVGKKYEGSIRGQVERALANANISQGNMGLSGEHKSRRDGRGRVPKGLPEKGQFKREPFSITVREWYALRKSRNAGMLKASWIAAGEALGGPKMSRVANWISTNLTRVEGAAKIIIGENDKRHEIWLINKMSYAGRAIKKGDMQKAVDEAFRRQILFMQIQISKVKF